MLIRCERCSTVYELDERVLPPAGAPVQCTRCQLVFTAYPPQAGARTLTAYPVPPAPPPPARPAAPAPAAVLPPAGSPGAVAKPASPGGPAAQRPRPPPRDPRNDTIQVFARQVRRRSLWMWLGPVLVLLAASGGYAFHRWRAGRVDPAALERRREGQALLLRDDTRSLEQAAALLAEAVRVDPKLYQAEADRALALVLLAVSGRDDAAVAEARFRGLGSERRADGGRGEAIQRMKSLQEEVEALRDRSRSLAEEAFSGLKVLARAHGDDLAVERALAVYYALDGNAEQSGKLVRNARRAGPPDAWVDLAAAVVASQAGAGPGREEVASRLGALAAAHPEMLRARILLARAQADLGRKDDALATLDGILARNPEHEGARRLKADLLGLPEPGPVAAAVPAKAPPPQKGGPPPKKRSRTRRFR